MPDDYSADRFTTGAVAVGGSTTGTIETAYDEDWFAVDLVAGRTYAIDLRGSPTDDGTLSDPYLRGIYDAGGNRIANTTNDDGGQGYNSRVTFTATESGTHYIAAGAWSSRQGTYEVEVTDTSPPIVGPDVDSGDPPDGQEQVQQQVQQQPPAFGSQFYGFELEENADGSVARLSLGAVSATDPDGGSVSYGIEGGNESGRFEIDAASGELFYVGAGEDYETGSTRFELTVRASDGDETTDTSVTVNVTDVDEPVVVDPPVTQPDQSTPQTVSEPAGEDFSRALSTSGRVAVGDTATGRIGSTGDRDWFAVELVAGRTYVIDLRGSPTDDGTLSDPYLRGIYDADGNRIANTTNDDGGRGYNSRLTFTATESGTHYIAAGAWSSRRGTYEVEVTDTSPPETPQEQVQQQPPAFDRQAYLFELEENADGSTDRLSLGAVSATDPDGGSVSYGIEGGNESGRFEIDAASGELFYVGGGEDYETGSTRFELTVRASDGDQTTDATVTVDVTDVAEAPAFAQAGYAFDLAENADGSVARLSLGAVSATDPDGGSVSYGIEGGNESGRFEIDAASGELFYVGGGEDYETGSTSFELTVRASDGEQTTDATVTVNVTDVAEAPSFAQAGYAFALAENADGSVARLSLGTVSATDPDGGSVSYGIEGGNESGRFEIGAASGELFYVGTGEDYETGSTRFELTVRASDGDQTTDATVTVDVTDAAEAPAFAQAGYAFALAENADGSVARLSLGTVSATDPDGGSVSYGIEGGNGSGRFEIDAASGELFYVGTGEDYETGSTRFELTVRASDGDETTDTSVTVNVTDVDEPVEVEPPVAQEVQSVPQTVSEGATDLPNDNSTPGRVVVGGSATGTIGSAYDHDRFAVELEAGRTYQFDLEGSPGGGGTLPDTYFRAIRDSEGRYQSGTYNDNFGGSRDSRVTFTPEASGTYYAQVSGDRDETGTYTLSVTDMTAPETDGSTTNPVIPEPQEPTVEVVGPDQDAQQQPETSQAQGEQESASEGATDLPTNKSTTGRVDVGSSATGAIGTPGDRDWFAVDLVAGKTYRFDLEGPPTSGCTLWDPYLRGIYDAGGTLIDGTTNNNGGVGRNSRVYFRPDEDTTYYVAAAAYRDNVGTYTLSVTEVADDYAGAPATTGTVEVGDSVEGSIETPGDKDWFAVELVAGKTYRFDLKGTPTDNGTLADPYLRGIYDADGDRIAYTTDDDGGLLTNSRVYFTAHEDATYYVAAGVHRYRSYTGTYTLSVTESPDDYSAGTETTGRVAVDGSTTGENNNSGDEDWFAVELKAGEAYRIDLERSPGLSGLRNPYLRGIYDADGDRIAYTTDDDGGEGRNSRVYFTPHEDATYYVAAGAHHRNSVGTYTLSVTEVTDMDDYAADPATTGTVAVGGSAKGNIDIPGDQDWFAVDLEAGKTYRFDLEGLRTSSGTLHDPYLRGIHDADGEWIADTADDDGGKGLNSRVYFTPNEDATYYVAAGAVWSYPGTYTLSVTELPDDYAAEPDPATTGTVAVGGSVEGNIETPRDKDWFAVELEAGTTYRFDLKGWNTGAGTLFDPYLRGIYDAGGERIDNTTDDNSGTSHNSRVNFTPDEDATYYVAAGAYRDYIGTYTLYVEEVDGM